MDSNSSLFISAKFFKIFAYEHLSFIEASVNIALSSLGLSAGDRRNVQMNATQVPEQ